MEVLQTASLLMHRLNLLQACLQNARWTAFASDCIRRHTCEQPTITYMLIMGTSLVSPCLTYSSVCLAIRVCLTVQSILCYNGTHSWQALTTLTYVSAKRHVAYL